MKRIVVDLEMNPIGKNFEARKHWNNEIIEIGAVMLDDRLQEVAAFKTYVKPELCEGIAPKITRLTHINDGMVENAPKFAEAFQMFVNWCYGTGEDIKVYAWSDNDYKQVSQELLLKNIELSAKEQSLMETEWKDFQKEFDNCLGFDRQLSLSFALEMAGIDFNGRVHDALDDARNTAELLSVFKDKDRFDQTLRKIENVMKPKPFGMSLGSLIDAAMVGSGR